MSRLLTLRIRLFVSYALVAAVGAAVMATVVEVVGRELFDHHVSGMGYGRAGHAGPGPAELRSAFGSALTQALLVAVAASLVAAVLAAVLVARRLLRPIDAIRATTHRLADGHYGEELAEPAEPELAALVRDVNSLGRVLWTTERRRAALIGDVAHEMRTPLTTLRGYADGLQDGLFTSEEVLPRIGHELTRLERLAADLAAVSRADEGGLSLHPVIDDLSDITRTVTERLRPQYSDKHVDLVVEAEAQTPITVDRDRMVQALTNLVGNALAYTPTGGTVRVVVTGRPDGTASVRVTDTGIGLDAQDLDRVFERFFRVSQSGHAGGSGVGLTIARAIVRAHGGDISATSAGPGKGSTFEVILPRPPHA